MALQLKVISSILGVFCKGRSHIYFSFMPSNSNIVNGGENFRPYPEKTFLIDRGLCAYYVLLLLRQDEFSWLQKIIKARFGSDSLKSDVTYRSASDEALAISYHEDFGGLLVEMTTNSLAVILEIDSCSFIPEPPWALFPKLEPVELEINKQGSVEYWWEHIWLPFWSSLAVSEKYQYLHDNNASAQWVECLAGQANRID